MWKWLLSVILAIFPLWGNQAILNDSLRGLIAVKEYRPGAGNFETSVYSHPDISGVALRFNWRDIQTGDNEYNWQFLDDLFFQAKKNNKQVVLIPVSGFETPDFIKRQVTTTSFARKYGRGSGQDEILPLFWDESYQRFWFSFLQKLSQRYGNDKAFKMIAASGPTSVSAEMSLPNSGEDILTWIDLGYRPSRYKFAWEKTFREYKNLFPNQYVSLALYPGLPISESGDKDKKQRQVTRQEIIDVGANILGKQFALQTSGLNVSKEEGEGYNLVKSYANRALTGFQLSSAMGTASGLQGAINRAFEARARYVEIYEPDVLDPSLQSVLEEEKAFGS